MSVHKPVLSQEEGVWVIRVPRPNGALQEFRCASEGQARRLMAVLATPDPNAPRPTA
jgi:hypothetical protein